MPVNDPTGYPAGAPSGTPFSPPHIAQVEPVLAALLPRADTISVEPVKGIGLATFSRATTAWVRGHDGVYQEAAINEARFEGARRVSGVYHLTDAGGAPLHPTHWQGGVLVFDLYPVAKRSTAYVVGDRRVPDGLRPYNDGAGGGAYSQDYVWLECTTAGTSHATTTLQSTGFGTTPGTTVSDGTVTWTVRGLYTRPGYLNEDARTNVVLHSRDFSQAPWAKNGTPTTTLNAVGIDGVANAAQTIEDDNATDTENFFQAFSIANDGNTHVASLYVKKEASETSFPAALLQYTSGVTPLNQSIVLNKRTGHIWQIAGFTDGSAQVEDLGAWWRIWMTLANNTTGNTTAALTIYPAVTATEDGGPEIAATGTVVADQAQLELNVKFPTSPIPTAVAAVTRLADALQYNIANFAQSEGLALVDVLMAPGLLASHAFVVVGTNTSKRPLSVNDPDQWEAFDGVTGIATGVAFLEADGVDRAGCRYSVGANDYRIGSVNTGSFSTPAAFAGFSGLADLKIGQGAGSGFFCGRISGVRLYDADPGQAAVEADYVKADG